MHTSAREFTERVCVCVCLDVGLGQAHVGDFAYCLLVQDTCKVPLGIAGCRPACF